MNKRMLSVLLAVVAPILLSGCSLLGLGGPPPLCEDQSVNNYVQKVGDQNTAVTDAAERIGELVSRLQNDPSLLDSSSWQNAVDSEVQEIIDANQTIQNLSSPRPELAVAHDLIQGAFQDYADGAQLMQTGLNQKSEQDIIDGVNTIEQGDNKLDGARDELQSVLSDCQWYQ